MHHEDSIRHTHKHVHIRYVKWYKDNIIIIITLPQQGGYVFTCFCFSVCLSLSLSVCQIIQKIWKDGDELT